MKPSLKSMISYMPEADEDLLKEHLYRLGDDYFKRFTGEDLKKHISFISKISSGNPVELDIRQKRDNSIECTVFAFDYPSEFSLITGILAGVGFNILSGDVYTYRHIERDKRKKSLQKRDHGRLFSQDTIGRRKIIDFFSGNLMNPMHFDIWSSELKKSLNEVIGLLEEGNEESILRAKNRVNEMVVKHLANLDRDASSILYPVDIEISNDATPFTHLRVISEDSPAFLYALSNALSLQDIVIEHVRIRTIGGRIEDRMDLLDLWGNKIEDREKLDRIKLSVLLTKQFTYFLGRAPDPYTALSRFETILNEIMLQPSREKWISHLTDPRNLQGLARLLGTSDFLWEDFIRLQYESLLPMVTLDRNEPMLRSNAETMALRLSQALEGYDSFEQKKKAVNSFKDQEIFLIDLDHILNPELGFEFLADNLTWLAELVVNKSTELVYNKLIEKYGNPRSIAGLNARYAILGLGKLGGAALGYASDIELLFVYSDKGRTDGDRSINNSEFFNILVKDLYQFIDAKREGIFQVDLRLRPYGDSGPLACSMESFCRYYGQDGQAHSYERLSLVRMRYIGGDSSFGEQLERIRDEIVYFSNNIDLEELRKLRERQIIEKSVKGKLNAKFSPGGLVDLEYSVQALQTLYGKEIPALRTARIHEALDALSAAGILNKKDSSQLISAYNFLRNLINGLRMLRGSARDLFLPPVESNEFGHLARRMGYERGGPIDSAQRLNMDLETHMTVVKIFAEKYFGRKSFSRFETGSIVDVVLRDKMPEELRNEILLKGGVKDPQRAYVNLQNLAGNGSRREVFARIAFLVWDIIKRMPDPDMALNNWERFIRSLASPEFHYNVLMSQPMQLEMILSIFSGSQFFSDTLIRNPGFFDWLINPNILHSIRKREEIEDELRTAAKSSLSSSEWLNKLRRFRRREILRIGTRDIYLGISMRIIMGELSTLAEGCTQAVLEESMESALNIRGIRENTDDLSGEFCIMAFGKLGGNELNYSSDIDLLGIYSDTAGYGNGKGGCKAILTKIMENVCSDLSLHTDEGYAYRVDLRLRPFGSSGELVQSISGLIDYYKKSASLWEIQAALKLRPVAGNLTLGYKLLDNLREIFYVPRDRGTITKEIEKMRNSAIRAISSDISHVVDIKSGMGGIRDVEFMVQGLQLIHAPDNIMLIEGNTLQAIDLLSEAGILPDDNAETLKEDYIFLRRTEHYIQILEDRQVHSLPKDEWELEALAKRMLGIESSAEQFLDKLNNCLKRVRDAYNIFLLKRRS